VGDALDVATGTQTPGVAAGPEPVDGVRSNGDGDWAEDPIGTTSAARSVTMPSVLGILHAATLHTSSALGTNPGAPSAPNGTTAGAALSHLWS